MVSELLNIENLKTYFYIYDGIVKAVDGINFSLRKGEALGIVGESGCGKTVAALSILRLISNPPGRIVDGKILFNGQNLLEFTNEQIRKVRGNNISMIFQEPMTSLNPVFKVGEQISETFRLHQELKRKDARKRSIEVLELVNIPNPQKCFQQYPHELSGGMRQRAMIAMALAGKPEILIADEPTTALDVTIQSQIIDILLDLKDSLGMAIFLITHDFGVIAEMVTRVIVMYAGKIIEEAHVKNIFNNPMHPYTRGLLKSVPKLGKKFTSGKSRLEEIPGNVPILQNLPKGCKFSTRCSFVQPICRNEEPQLVEIEPDHYCSCWIVEEIM